MLTVDYDLLEVRPGHRLLDAGCGAGRHSFEAFRRGAHVFALDYDPEECRKVLYSFASASEQDRQKGGTWHMLHGDILCLPFADRSFDRVICSEVCEHLFEDMRLLRELNRVMKPKGRMALTVPTSITERLYGWIEPFYFENPGGHVRIFTPRELAAKLRRAGFKVFALRFAHGFHSPYWLLRCIFGLEKEDHPVSRTYRKFLEMVIRSNFMSRLERKVCDKVWPKSIIFYVWKPGE